MSGAHPDDTLLGAGGLAAWATTRGISVHFLTFTRGERGGDPCARVGEEEAAAAILGCSFKIAGLRDAMIDGHRAIAVFEDAVRRIEPSMVLVHAPNDSHQDHRCLSEAAVSVCRFVPNLLFYEGPSTQNFEPNMVLDISEVWDRKCEALRAHRSQLDRAKLLEWADPVSAFRAWPCFPSGRCEAYRAHHCDVVGMSRLLFCSALRTPKTRN